MNQSVTLLFVRIFIYMLVMGAMAHLVMMEGYRDQTGAEYSEQSLVEWLESISALLASVCFLCAAVIYRPLRAACVMLAALTAMMFIREADFFLDAVFDGAWQALVTVVLLATGLYLWRQTLPIRDSILAYAREPSSGVMLAGILVTIVYSRLFGRGSFWEALMGDGYQRAVKNAVEEGTELAGYALMFIAAVEILLVCFSRRRSSPAN